MEFKNLNFNIMMYKEKQIQFLKQKNYLKEGETLEERIEEIARE